ncbi:hypothetical protein CPter91_4466 [Collimonas pratensis]|uniref:Uncharacterized protein n=1 Tax=Collimonas pratensis TaxID=279113 RepID=A0A127Q9Q4_9BURK|nr:hypothetical protein CPter91_4466 [Collimonas pratensis]
MLKDSTASGSKPERARRENGVAMVKVFLIQVVRRKGALSRSESGLR